MLFATFFTLLTFINLIAAYPVQKRIYQPTSPVFSLIAHHQGAVFQDNLVKFDGVELTLASDDKAFFGRIKANNGYVLNIPLANQSSNSSYNASVTAPSNINVYVDKDNKLTTTKNNTSSSHFGVSHSLLTYKNSTKFRACPTSSYRGEYLVYFDDGKTLCPRNATGYDITLLVQIAATLNYNPDTNQNNLYKRLLSYIKF